MLAMIPHIKERFPVTWTDLRQKVGTRRAEIYAQRMPAAFRSQHGKVQRWPGNALADADACQCGIVGLQPCKLKIVRISQRMDIRRLRAWGSYAQMHLLLTTARRQWQSLPGGREIETLFEQMFPAVLTLMQETVETDRKALRKLREKPKTEPTQPESSQPPVDYPSLPFDA